MSSPPNGSGWSDDGWGHAPYGTPPSVPRRSPLVWAMGVLIVVLLIALAGIVGYLLASDEHRPVAAPAPRSTTIEPSTPRTTPTGSNEDGVPISPAGVTACDPDEISGEAGIARRNVNIDRCLGDWALAHVYVPPGEPAGDTQYIVGRVDGAWSRYTSIPSGICADDAESDGMPAELSRLLDECPRSEVSTGDLGLSTPMTRPLCDGRGIVVLYSAVTPGAYAQEISSALATYPGSSYLRTDMACPSLRPRDENGNVIYAVYQPSGYTRQELCGDVRAAGPPAYGRWLDTTSDPSALVSC
ncbi:hypothetical protein [Dietzia sp. B32]|uniref:hypothetical protein n=1 Tax=Dietzia sp. B32 TaxID=2915130 RepID=UPI0021AD9C4C|nr:hypothetical protein [Dietzia sp. B32]UVE95074.1 hypothetical protein L8M95_16505 [Dietzia sp. B32]